MLISEIQEHTQEAFIHQIFSGCSEEEIDEFCKKLPRYKRPRKLIFAKVPRNPTGKIEKPKLREKYGAAHLVAAQNQVEIK